MSSAPYSFEMANIKIPRDGLVGVWGGNIVNDTIPDGSDNGNDGTFVSTAYPTKQTLFGRALSFEEQTSTDGLITAGDKAEFAFGTSTDFSVVALFRCLNTDSLGGIIGQKLNGGVNPGMVLHISAAGLVTGYISDSTTQYTRSLSQSVEDGLWHLGGYTADRSANMQAFVDREASTTVSISGIGDIDNAYELAIGGWLGTSSSNMLRETDLAFVALYNRTMTQAEFQAIYDQVARAVQFKTDWGVAETVSDKTGGFLGEPGGLSPFEIISGTWKISNDTIEGQTCKVIECVSAGAIAAPVSLFYKTSSSEAAYGTWDFWFYKGGASNFTEVAFIADEFAIRSDSNQDGYVLRFRDDESLYMQTITSGGLASNWGSSASAYAIDTWYNARITRDWENEFTGYIRAEDADFALMPATVGTNPATSATHKVSNYLLLDFDAGDKFSYSDMQGGHCFQKGVGVVVT